MVRTRPFLHLLNALVLGAAAVHAEYTPPSANPEHFTVLGDHLYFVADDGIHGRELWRTDGKYGNAELVCDVTPGIQGSAISQLRVLGEYLTFKVDSPDHGGELWRSDGTPAGTRMVRRFEWGPEKGYDVALGKTDAFLFMRVTSRFAKELWISDGSIGGTRTLTEGLESDQIPNLHGDDGHLVLGRYLYFGALKRDGSVWLWRSDGTPEGTQSIRRFWEGPEEFFPVGDDAFVFRGIEEDSGAELWRSDGTYEGTTLLREFRPGRLGGNPNNMASTSPSPGVPAPPHGVVFTATTEDHGAEVWITDGTEEGTRLFADIDPGPGSSDPYRYTAVDSAVYFIARTPATGRELWRLNVESGVAVPTREIYPGLAESEPYALHWAGAGTLLFAARDGEHGEELWRATGVEGKVTLVTDIFPGPGHAEPYGMTTFHNQVYFAANHPLYGRELWVSTSKPEGTRLLVDVHTDGAVNPPSNPGELTPLGDLMLFSADDITHGRELWRTDGSWEGTALVRDVYPGRPGSYPEELTPFAEVVYFRAEDAIRGVELWVTDATEAGTHFVDDINLEGSAYPHHLTVVGDQLFFAATRETEGTELWALRIGDTPRLIRDIAPGDASSNPSDLTEWQGYLYFTADDAATGRELWRSDGTFRGTELVRDIVPLPIEVGSLTIRGQNDRGMYVNEEDADWPPVMWRLETPAGPVHRIGPAAKVTP